MIAGPAVFAAAFLACLVEAIETLTLLLAVAFARGWRPALIGAAAGLGVLALLVIALQPLLQAVPRQGLHLVVGILLMLFGAGWLRKAVLRIAGAAASHDQEAEFAAERDRLAAPGVADGVAIIAAFKAVLLEGIEVVFVILAMGGPDGRTASAIWGAAVACLLVLGAGAALRRPLARLPENTVKFWTGVMLMAFGLYWTAEGLGGDWPGGHWSLVALIAAFAGLGHLAVSRIRHGASA